MSGTSLLASFSAWCLKNISVVMFSYLTKFQCLVAFSSWDIGQYAYCYCLLTRLWRQNFEIILIFLIKVFLLHDTWPKCQDKDLNILRTKIGFKDEIKSIFHHFWRAFIEANKFFFWGGKVKVRLKVFVVTFWSCRKTAW